MALTRFRIDILGEPSLTIEGEGVVAVLGAPPDDPGPAIAQFVAGLSPGLVERLAFDREARLGPSGTLTGHILAVIAELATGGPG